jgi:hypothetical protein
MEFGITVSDLVIPDVCPALGIHMNMNSGRPGAYDNSPSLDRMDSTRGYTKDNIHVISQAANRMKGNATREQLLLFAKWINDTFQEVPAVVQRATVNTTE